MSIALDQVLGNLHDYNVLRAGVVPNSTNLATKLFLWQPKIAKLLIYVQVLTILYDLIPQDLVKSHLMLAVREEVEDLKLQIKGLVEKNNQLEQENKLLRASAAPETIAQLTLLNRTQNH